MLPLKPSLLGNVALLSAALLVAPRVQAVANNALVNSSFGSDIEGWNIWPNPDVTVAWSGSLGWPTLGAFTVTTVNPNKLNDIVAKQCVNVYPNTSYTVGTRFRYPSSAATAPRGSVNVTWSTGLGCLGSTAGLSTGPLTPSTPDTWLSTQATFTSPVTAKSAMVQFGIQTAEAKHTTAAFDEVFMKAGTVGDANGSHSVTVEDVFYLINMLFAGGARPVGPCDVDADDDVDVQDVFYLVAYLFANGPAPIS